MITMMYMLKKQQGGFTIVELLIVIMIIGILATLIITTFSGIRQKAENTASASNMREWAKAFTAYEAQSGKVFTLPSSAGGTGYCLGTDFPNDKCRLFNQSGSQSYAASTADTVYTQLADEGVKAPKGSSKPVKGTVGTYLLAIGDGVAPDPDVYELTGPFWGSDMNEVCGDLGFSVSWAGNGQYGTCKYRLKIN
tara:strand:+ start:339 stop:923 length:585 start_codon:yes stop_codon:yes gene_type:complete